MNASKLCTAAVYTVIFLFALQSCSNQYSQSKTIAKTSAYPSTLERAMKNKRYFVLQSGINLYTVTSVDLNKTRQQMTVTLDKIDSLHLRYFRNPAMRPARTSPNQPLRPDIYVFMKDSASYTLDEPHTIPVERIAKIELLD